MASDSQSERPRRVELLVKNPCDRPGTPAFSLSASLSQTVGDIKAELATSYHGKPSVDRQRLIFSGKLLADDAKLESVLAGYEVSEPQTFHIVVAEAVTRNVLSTTASPATRGRADAAVSAGELSDAPRGSGEPSGSRPNGGMGSGGEGRGGARTLYGMAPNPGVYPAYAAFGGGATPASVPNASAAMPNANGGAGDAGGPSSGGAPGVHGIPGPLGPHGMPMMYGHPAAVLYGYGGPPGAPPPYWYQGMAMPPPPEDGHAPSDAAGLGMSEPPPEGVPPDDYQRYLASMAAIHESFEQGMAAIHHHHHHAQAHHHAHAHHHHHHAQHQHLSRHHEHAEHHYPPQHHGQQHEQNHQPAHHVQNDGQHAQPPPPGAGQGPRRRAFGIAVEFDHGRGGVVAGGGQFGGHNVAGGVPAAGPAGAGDGGNAPGRGGVNVGGQMGFVHNGNVNLPRVRHYVFQIELNAFNWSLIFKLAVAVLLLKQEVSAQHLYSLIFAAVLIYLWQTDRLGAVRRLVSVVLPSPPELFEALASAAGQEGGRRQVNRVLLALSYAYSFVYGFVCSLLPSWEPIVLPDINELLNRNGNARDSGVGTSRSVQASGGPDAADNREPGNVQPAGGDDAHPHAD